MVDCGAMKRLFALAAGIAATVSALPSPASAAEKFPVPEDTGIYLGTGVYEESGRMLCGGFCFSHATVSSVMSVALVLIEMTKPMARSCSYSSRKWG